MTGLQWISGEAMTIGDGLHTPAFMPYLGGALGIDIHLGKIPGLRDFLLRINPEQHHSSNDENSMVGHQVDNLMTNFKNTISLLFLSSCTF